MARKLRRYRFSGIERLTREQLQVHNALLRYLPQTPFERGFKDKLRQVVEPLVHADVDLWLDGLTTVPAGGLVRALGSPLCLGVVGLTPKLDRAILEVDLTIAQQAIERMLGGSSEDVDGTRPLSEIEEGVLAFLFLKVLRLAQEDFGTENSLGLKLEGICSDLEALKARVDVEQEWVALSFKLFFDVAVGYCRVYLPKSLIVRDLQPARPEPGPALSRWLRSIAARAGRVAALKTELCIEVGRIGLALPDLEQLEAEDIILIENPDVRLTDGVLGGRVSAHVGRGERGLIHGTLMLGENGLYEVAIDEIHSVGEPHAHGHLGAGEGEYVEQEQSRRLSAATRHSAPLAAAVRARLADRLRDAGTAPLPAGRELDDEGLAEHSDGEYEEEEGGEAYEEADEEPLAESAGMLGDVAVSMVVELGRVEVSAADIVALRPGQVIELSRSPGDAVDLVVDNRRIGKGELVEIEGELGVRILSLAR